MRGQWRRGRRLALALTKHRQQRRQQHHHRLVRGTRDVLPELQREFKRIYECLEETACRYGYIEMSTPILEHGALFQRSLGATSDVVNKEMFSFQDADDSQLCLRPEGTAGVMRAVINNFASTTAKQRLFYFGPMFRRERPQKGRYRQFWQGGVECFGRDSPSSDVESIALAYDFLSKLGIHKRTKLEVNSLFDAEARRWHRVELTNYFERHRTSLSATSQQRLDAGNPLRILDSKDEGDKALLADAPQLAAFASDADLIRHEAVLQGLTALGIPYETNPNLVRGLDYYTHTVWEFVVDAEEGAQNAVLAGGRYDGLATTLGSKRPIPAIGWACGVDRLVLLRHKNNVQEPAVTPQAAIVEIHDRNVDSQAAGGALAPVTSYALQVASQLRQAGVSVVHEHRPQVKHQLKEALNERVGYLIFVGSQEIQTQSVQLKDVQTEQQQRVSLNLLAQHLSSHRLN